MVEVECKICGKKVMKHAYRLRVYKNLFCSISCKQLGHKGYKHSEESKEKISQASLSQEHKGGHHLSEETKKKISEYARKNLPVGSFKKGFTPWNKGIEWHRMRGENSPCWIVDRTQLATTRNVRGDSGESVAWARKVKVRDSWKCKIADENCNGIMEAHHILDYKSYPELRYKLNNGITLCHAHHPRKRIDVQRLIPVFQELVGSK